MSLRSDWQAAKAKAKAKNGKKEVKFTTKQELGPLLDAYEAADKAHTNQEIKNKPENKAWAKIAQTYVDTAIAANTAAAYLKDLDNLHLPEEAHEAIRTGITRMSVRINRSVAEGKKLTNRIAAAKKEA